MAQRVRRRFDLGWIFMVLIIIIVGSWIISSMFSTSLHQFRSETDLTQAILDNEVDENIRFSYTNGSNYIGPIEIRGTIRANFVGEGNKYRHREFVLITNEIPADWDQNSATPDTSYISFLQTLIINNTINITLTQEIINNVDVWGIVFNIVLILLIIGGIITFIRAVSKASKGNTQAFSFGKSPAKLGNHVSTKFSDVAGCEEEKAELFEIVDFLKNPAKYTQMGAKIPKGVLLCGSPGTGKTLLAKAVSGEAGVPFFSISGSDFVEMFVGVGAARVRDLFKNAKASAPCIIFIDEIDAVGRQRGAGLGGGHDEKEQTLNQLLVEMDGFDDKQAIIILAATNRPDVLDPALLRPGRFDRSITIDLPNVAARKAILEVHARNKNIAPNVDFEKVAQRLPGFSGADIANVLNEAALLAARENRSQIILKDIDEATDRVMMGPAKHSKKYTEAERKMVAYHEAGHAVIGLKVKDANVVQKITIIPRGRAGGYNLMIPENETYYRTKEQLLASITSSMGGRVAEELIIGQISTGAYGDFQSATQIARSMVTEYGMSDLGPIQLETRQGSVFLGRDYGKEKNFSEHFAVEIDREVTKILNNAYNEAKTVIQENLNLLHTIANSLLVLETLTKEDIDEINNTGNLQRAHLELNSLLNEN